jgi:hypothetical protein
MAQTQPRRFAQIVHLKPSAVAAYNTLCLCIIWTLELTVYDIALLNLLKDLGPDIGVAFFSKD